MKVGRWFICIYIATLSLEYDRYFVHFGDTELNSGVLMLLSNAVKNMV